MYAEADMIKESGFNQSVAASGICAQFPMLARRGKGW